MEFLSSYLKSSGIYVHIDDLIVSNLSFYIPNSNFHVNFIVDNNSQLFALVLKQNEILEFVIERAMNCEKVFIKQIGFVSIQGRVTTNYYQSLIK